jgi:hypothetical protein
VISERAFRLTPPKVIFSYLPEILQKLGVHITRKEERTANDAFHGVIEGVKTGDGETHIRIQLHGVRETWSHIGGNFLPSVLTTRMRAETQQYVRGREQDTAHAQQLLQQFNSTISRYVWHTSG